MDDSLPRPRGAAEVRQALLAAATSLIARRGVAAVTTRAIASAARVNQGLITRYFGTKEDLVKAVATDVAQTLFSQVVDRGLGLDAVLVGESGRGEALRALTQILVDAETPGGLVDPALVAQFFGWMRQQAGGGDDQVFLVVALTMGSELVSPNLRADLGLSEDEFREVKRRAYQRLARALEAS